MSFKRELNVQVIKTKIEKIKDSLIFIEETLPDNSQKLKESKLIRNAVYKEVEFAIEQILDICSHINAGLRLGVPDTEDDILKNLEVKKIFNKPIIELISEMKKFRNILVHKYGDIDDAKAYSDIKKGLKDFETVITELDAFLGKPKTKKKNKKN